MAAARIEALEATLGEVLVELRDLRLEVGDEGTRGDIREGSMVLITSGGRYKGRKARVGSRRGKVFWNLTVLKLRGEAVAPRVYRKETSLRLLVEKSDKRG